MMPADGTAEGAGDEEPVAGAGAAATDGTATGRLADDGDGDRQRAVPAVGVAADQGGVEGIGRLAEAEIQLFGDRATAGPRQANTDDRGDRPPGHRGDVAQVDGHR